MPLNLNARQQKFISAYLKSGNKTQAAIEAGYSEENAESIGSRLSRNVKVMAVIEAKRAKLTANDEMDAAWVRQHVKDIIVENKDEQPMVALKGLELASRYNGMFNDGTAGAPGGLSIVLELGGPL